MMADSNIDGVHIVDVINLIIPLAVPPIRQSYLSTSQDPPLNSSDFDLSRLSLDSLDLAVVGIYLCELYAINEDDSTKLDMSADLASIAKHVRDHANRKFDDIEQIQNNLTKVF